jgi:hypothetical protein
MTNKDAGSGHSPNPDTGLKSIRTGDGNAALPLVVTPTVNGAGNPPVMITVAGAMHIAPSGAPLQVKATVPL